MDVNLIEQAVPLFFLLIATEALFAWLKGAEVYRLGDSISSLACGVCQQVVDALSRVLLLGAYLFVYSRCALVPLPDHGVWIWPVALVMVDACYYLYHRLSHTVGLLWAVHIPHHHSEEFNLTTALRQGAFESSFSYLVYLGLAVVGLPPFVFLVTLQAMTLYQFGIHTRLVDRLGPLEWLFVTPSHHRVHHGRNPRYINKNYGAILILWDKLFGTFQVEDEPAVYGTISGLNSWNAGWAQVHYWAELGADSRRQPRWVDRLLLPLRPPGWGSPTPHEASDAVVAREKYAPPLALPAQVYLLLHFVLAIAGTQLWLGEKAGQPLSTRLGLGMLVAATMVSLGGLADGRRWAPRLELARLGAIALVAALLPALALAIKLAIAVAAGLCAAWLLAATRHRPT